MRAGGWGVVLVLKTEGGGKFLSEEGMGGDRGRGGLWERGGANIFVMSCIDAKHSMWTSD